MTTTTLPLSAEVAVGHPRELLTDSTLVYSSYVHFFQPGQNVFQEYCNMSDGVQKISAALLTLDGNLLVGSRVKTYHVEPLDLLRIDTAAWARETGANSFSGQLMVLVDQINSHGAKPVYPAITAHWVSPSHHCEIATAAFGRINLKSFQGKKSFYMYCSMAVYDARRTTTLVLFNNSTDAAYQDSVALEASLVGKNGERLVGPAVTIKPFGTAVMDIGVHFGVDGETFLAKNQGHVGVTLRHSGHTFPAYFFHMDRHTRDILSGQHAQPPMAALTHFGIWWGKLRQFSL